MNQSFITSPRPYGVAVDGSHILLANGRGAAIGRADLDGRNMNQSSVAGTQIPPGVAVNGGRIYQTRTLNNTVGRADLDGQNVDAELHHRRRRGTERIRWTPNRPAVPALS